MELEFWVYVKLLISSAVVSSVLNLGYNWWKDGRERKRECSALALDAALTLERFTRSCARMIEDARAAYSEVERTQSYDPLSFIKLPSFAYPEAMAWKWLDPSVAARLREFPEYWEASRRYLGNVAEYSDFPPDCAPLTAVECARLGQQAWVLGAFVREHYSLPKASLAEHDKDIHEIITRKLNEYEKIKAQQEVNNKRMAEELSAHKDQFSL